MPVSASFPVTPSSVPGASMPVDIYVKDTTPSTLPIPGVKVTVVHPETFVVLASAVTDSDGRAAFLLEGSADPGTPYEVRLYKLGVTFRNPHHIRVLDPLGAGETNRFDVSGTPTTLPQAVDPLCCRCTGLFVNFANRPIAGATLRVLQKVDAPSPKVLGGNAVASQAMSFQTNSNGYVSFDLPRGGKYLVMLASDEETAVEITVPDAPAVNLTDLLYPFPVLLDWDDSVAAGDAVSLAVGETLEVPFTLTMTNLEVLDDQLGKYVDFLLGDTTFVDGAISGGKLVLTGKAAGSTTATPERRSDLTPARNPEPDFTAPALAITVTA